MYKLVIQTDFAAAHHLRDYPGNCERLHGHNWKLDVVVASETLDDQGMVCDFRLLKKLVDDVVGRLDHQCLNQVPPFDTLNPTTENLARYVADSLTPLLPSGVSAVSVTAWESEHCGASYVPEGKESRT